MNATNTKDQDLQAKELISELMGHVKSCLESEGKERKMNATSAKDQELQAKEMIAGDCGEHVFKFIAREHAVRSGDIHHIGGGFTISKQSGLSWGYEFNREVCDFIISKFMNGYSLSADGYTANNENVKLDENQAMLALCNLSNHLRTKHTGVFQHFYAMMFARTGGNICGEL